MSSIDKDQTFFTPADPSEDGGTPSSGTRSKQEVGYKRPPMHSRFKPGQSGNPKGRKKGEKSFSKLVEQELDSVIPVTENGRKRNITKRQALAKTMVKDALAGKAKALELVLGTDRESREAFDQVAAALLAPADELTRAGLLQRLREAVHPQDDAPADAKPKDQDYPSTEDEA